MKALTFNIKLVEPLLIANPISGDENSAAGLDFIPGSVIRGVLAQSFTKGQKGDLNDSTFRHLFFGKIRFLNAYITSNSQRFLPSPFSWHMAKEAKKDTDPVVDLAHAGIGDKSLEKLKAKYVCITAPSYGDSEDEEQDDEGAKSDMSSRSYFTCATPQHHISAHIFQPNRRKATKAGEDTVFRYDALAAEQLFSGIILGENEKDLAELKAHLEQDVLKLGKSRSAGYGAIKILNAKIEPEWREYTPAIKRDGKKVIVTLLSDAILRDPQTGAFSSSIETTLGHAANLVFAEPHVTGGFNLAWGLPLPQSSSIRAGSVFVFERTDALMSALRTAEQNGIGERRVDGFGRIAIDWHISAEYLPQQNNPPPAPQKIFLKGDSTTRRLAQTMVDRMWRQQLDEALRDAIGSSSIIKNGLSNTQISRFRMLAREALRLNDPNILLAVLKEPDQDNMRALKPHARQQFERGKVVTITTSRLLEWLKSLAGNPERVWDEIKTNKRKRPTLGGLAAKDPPALEYAARLIDGVLKKASLKEEDRNE